ncbi:MAG: hypothetical protein II407_06320, partial [Prevotella sp.]|nr:hypothetical protein [Prevotella sp.]
YKIVEGKSITPCTSEGKAYTGAITTGLVHPSYGAVSATWVKDDSGYDADEDAYYVNYEWTVSAGSFGTGYNLIKILSKL